MPVRIVVYVAGIFMVSLGIVLCKKCNLGISPISSIPYVLELIVPLSFGTLTTLFHFVNTAAQMILSRKFTDGKLWLQVPLAFVFGRVIDWVSAVVNFDGTVILYQMIALVLSVFFTALGMVCMLGMNLIQNPPDGTVKQIAQMAGKEVGSVKVIYDVSCVVLSLAIGLVFLRRIAGFGVATIVSAIFVGKTVTWIKMFLAKVRSVDIR